MKSLSAALIMVAILLPLTVNAQTGKIPLSVYPHETYAGNSVSVVPDSGKSFLYDAPAFYKAMLDSFPVVLTSASKYKVTFTVPQSLSPGEHIISITVTDGPFGSAPFVVRTRVAKEDTLANGGEADPNKQYGDSIEAGKDPIGKERGGEVVNPPGGYGNKPFVTCDSLHKIDGKFTDSVVGSRKEWQGIIPLNGRFSHLYVDYCNQSSTLYFLNDWYLATKEPDSSSCYNRFIIYTADARETWEIRVYHSLEKGTKIYRNRVDVSNDTNYVVGGKFGFGSSPLVEKAHTIYEFGIKAQQGHFFMPSLSDPVSPEGPKTVCNESGYGLITDPSYFSGHLGNEGVSLREDSRYIPLSGVAGLTTEPTTFGGELKSDSSTTHEMGTKPMPFVCGGEHTVDGEFSTLSSNLKEWSSTPVAKGKFSNLYADYCNGTLYILNDWVLGTEEPDKRNCYNLFELFTGGGKQHWGIYVYHSISKGIRVFLNGKDVSTDSTIVKGGKFGFDVSPLMPDKQHTIYEFAIAAEKGAWNIFLADPGPSSFCDRSNEALPRLFDAVVGMRKQSVPTLQSTIQLSYIDTTHIVFSTEQNTAEWGGSRFKVTLQYNSLFFKPINVLQSSGQNISPAISNLTWKIVQPGVLEIEGVSSKGFTSKGDLFILDGIALIGSDSVSTISGTLEIGNSAVYMRRSTIQSVTLTASQPISVREELLIGNSSVVADAMLVPNPTKDGNALSLHINLRQNIRASLQICDVSGKVIYTKPEMNLPIGEHIIALNPGITESGAYFLKLSTNYGMMTLPFVVKH